MECGDFGGETAKGQPCTRAAGWGRDASTGPCKHHRERPHASGDVPDDWPPPPPDGMSEDARGVWRAAVDIWVLGPEELLTLRGALESWDLYARARDRLSREGTVVESDSGAVKRHPAAIVARDALRDYRAGMAELGIQIRERPDGVSTTETG